MHDASPRDITSVFIVGAGTMGCEIAAQCARHGVRVSLHDSKPLALERARARLQELACRSEAVLSRIELTPSLDAAARADLVLECIPENVSMKQRVFAELSARCGPDAILVTNTSSLVPSQLAASCTRPERFAALHFHLPVATSNVVDVMPHPHTDPGVIESLIAFARKIGQITIRYAREYHGYIFNSIFGAMQRQALDLVIEGIATFEDVDRSWMGIFKMPIGPFGMFDGIGLDSLAEVLGHWAETLNDDAGRKRVRFLRLWVDQGYLGAKTGRGFYHYPNPAYSLAGFLTPEDSI